MKKYLYIISAIAIMSISIMSIDISLQSNDLPAVSLANIEALASENTQPMDCYSNISTANDGRPVSTMTYCGDCRAIKCTHWSNMSRCMR